MTKEEFDKVIFNIKYSKLEDYPVLLSKNAEEKIKEYQMTTQKICKEIDIVAILFRDLYGYNFSTIIDSNKNILSKCDLILKTFEVDEFCKQLLNYVVLRSNKDDSTIVEIRTIINGSFFSINLLQSKRIKFSGDISIPQNELINFIEKHLMCVLLEIL